MTILGSRLFSTGELALYNGNFFDEITQTTISQTRSNVMAAEFDEVTLGGVVDGVVKREWSNGNLSVGGFFSETTDAPTNFPPVFPTLTLVASNKTPVLGSTGQTIFPALGWTSIVSATADDASIEVRLPFTITFNNTQYNSYFPSSNFYITFGAGFGAFIVSASNPAANKIFFAGADNSWQRVSTLMHPDYHRLRFEGTASTAGSPGTPNMVYELTFFNPNRTSNEIWIELLVGIQARTGAISGIYSSSALLPGGQIIVGNTAVTANTSYVFVGNSTGQSWTVYSGQHVGNLGAY